MARRKTARPAAAVPIAVPLPLDHAQKLFHLEENQGKRPLWTANPCVVCSDNFARGKYIAGTGLDPADPSRPCPRCFTGDPASNSRDGKTGSGYGPQFRALTTSADEILLGGARRGGKSDAAIAFLCNGNPHLPLYANRRGEIIPVNESYLRHHAYRALVLRKNANDLRGFIEEMKVHLAYYGGVWLKNDMAFRFPSGAMIWCGHLEHESSYEKYIGFPQLHRVVIEELTFIPKEETYLKILSSLSSTYPDLRTQVLCTTNPAGAGVQWVKTRFVKVRKTDGSLHRRGDLITYDYQHPKDPTITLTRSRVFIEANVYDNPHVPPEYVALLLQMSPRDQRIYLHGDWDVGEGAFFDLFRNPLEQNLPFAGEPERACHVITKRKGFPVYKPWDLRAIGGDWGFSHETAYYWGARLQSNQQIHIYKELVASKAGAEEIGMKIARMSIDELNDAPNNKLVLWFSPDAVRKRRGQDTGHATFAELIAFGISKVIGSNAVSMPEAPDPSQLDLLNQSFRDGWREFATMLNKRKEMGIEIRSAHNDRKFGWHLMYSAMSWEDPREPKTLPSGETVSPILPEAEFSNATYQLIYRQAGPKDAELYRQSFDRTARAYPQLQIHETCKRLIEAIPLAIADSSDPEDITKQHWRGADSVDACRYLICGLRSPNRQELPVETRRDMRMDAIREQNPGMDLFSLSVMHQHITNEEEESSGPAYVRIGRRATAKRRALGVDDLVN